ncbi:MAG: hypothetical protein DIKNOCCD_03200 [bacterium]|nr:hypothetical protein [bacterium]
MFPPVSTFSGQVQMAHVTSGKDRSDLRYHLVERDWDVFVGRYPVLLFREAAGLDRPVIEKAIGARSTPPEGDVAGTHNGLRSHGRFRCLAIRLRRTHWSGLRQIPTGGEFEMSKRVHGCTRAVKQGGSKNGERENSEGTFSVSARNPQGCTRPPDCGLRNGESG